MADLSPVTARIIAEATAALASFTPENIREAHEENRKQLELTAEAQAAHDQAVKDIDKAGADKKALEAYDAIVKHRADALIDAQKAHADAVAYHKVNKAALEKYRQDLQARATDLAAREDELEKRSAAVQEAENRLNARVANVERREEKATKRESKIKKAAEQFAD